jgi:hypothetical protein
MTVSWPGSILSPCSTPRPGAWTRSFPASARLTGSGQRGALGGRYGTCSGISQRVRTITGPAWMGRSPRFSPASPSAAALTWTRWTRLASPTTPTCPRQRCSPAGVLPAQTHADDIGVPVTPGEHPERTAWRARYSRFAVRPALRLISAPVPGAFRAGHAGSIPAARSTRSSSRFGWVHVFQCGRAGDPANRA